MDEQEQKSFEEAGQAPPPGLLAELIDCLVHNKKYWLVPLLLVLLILGVIAFLGGTAAAPFIYSFF